MVRNMRIRMGAYRAWASFNYRENAALAGEAFHLQGGDCLQTRMSSLHSKFWWLKVQEIEFRDRGIEGLESGTTHLPH